MLVDGSLIDPVLWGEIGLVAGRIVLVLVLASVLLRIIRTGVDRWISTTADYDRTDPRRQRAETLGNLIRSSARYVIWTVAAITVLDQVNVDVGALIATAGVAGLAIGFGAQTLVKDVIGGVFLLFDDTIHVGDLVRISGEVGTVEEIGVRLIKVRQFDGELRMIPAGEVRAFGNKSLDWSRVIVPVGLSYDQDIDALLPVVQRVADEWAEEHRDVLLDEQPQVQSVTNFGESSVDVRIIAQVKPGEQFAAEREIRQRLKRAFDAASVEIPFPQRTVRVIEGAAPPPRTPVASDADAPNAGSEGAD
jgi:small conductance mechanosensitive channel